MLKYKISTLNDLPDRYEYIDYFDIDIEEEQSYSRSQEWYDNGYSMSDFI